MFGWRQEADRGQSLQRSRFKANGLTGAVDTGLFLTSAASRLRGVADLREGVSRPFRGMIGMWEGGGGA